jgi:hypothetical protein
VSCLYGTLNNEFQDTSQLIFEPFYYYDSTSPGYFSLLQKRQDGTHHDSYRLSQITDVIPRVDRRFDTYLSQNVFWGCNRRVVNLAWINVNYLDLDTYTRPNLENLLPEDLAYRLLGYCEDKKIPTPSLILFSGRGLQVKWIPKRSLPSKALPRWNALQRHLAERFEPFGADVASLDASRVLRLERTVNTKSGQVVRVLYPSGLARPVEYDFDMLADSIFIYTREEIKTLRAARAEKKAAKAARAARVDPARWKFTQESLHWNRIKDMEDLARLRGWNHGNPDGRRFPFMFLAAISLSWITPPTAEYPSRLYQELEAEARKFAPHWTTAKIREHVPKVYKRFKAESLDAQKNPERYRYTNQYALDMLQVTPEEEKSMRTLISKGEKKRRNREAMERIRRGRGMLSRAEYESQRLIQVGKRQKEAIEMRQNGLSNNEIALKLGVTVRHAIRLIRGGDMVC